MNAAASEARQRIERLLALTRALVAPGTAERARLCESWVQSTGLSPEGVEWALDQCLELQPSEAELSALIGSVASAPRAQVILPAQVFVAAHRALALALAAAPRVYVRASRRDPTLLAALSEGAAGLFEPMPQLAVEPGDHVWAYGADLTLSELRRQLPPGAVLHAHGSGFGVAVVDAAAAERSGTFEAIATAIAADTLCFDQRGCLSPRLVLALGNQRQALELSDALFEALRAAGQRVPRGRFTPEEQAEERWYRQCAACFGAVRDTGHGTLSSRPHAQLLGQGGSSALNLPPAGRHLQLVVLQELEPALLSLGRWLTSAGCSDGQLEARVRGCLPRARVVPLGCMQKPSFDGPVDRRADPAGERILPA